MMNMQVYILNWDFNHSGDSERDAFHVPFEGDDKVEYLFSNPKLYSKELLPKVIYFEANISIVNRIDYLLTDLIIPVMSTRMLSLLKNVGAFEYDSVPVIILDDTDLSVHQFDREENLKPRISIDQDYVAIRPTEYLTDCFDYERSKYQPSRSNPAIPGRISRIILRHSSQKSFPPFFKVDVLSGYTFVSSEAKEILIKEGITGCTFEKIDVSV